MAISPDQLAQIQSQNLWVVGVYLIIVIAITIYSLYLSRKQAKVLGEMTKTKVVLEEIRDDIKEIKGNFARLMMDKK